MNESHVILQYDEERITAMEAISQDIVESIGLDAAKMFYRWSPERQLHALDDLPAFSMLPLPVKKALFVDIAHFMSIASFSTH
jgi:hypothetical protein